MPERTRADAPFTWAGLAGILLTLGSFTLFLVILVRSQEGRTASDLDREVDRPAATHGEADAQGHTAVGTSGLAAVDTGNGVILPTELRGADLAELVGTPVLLDVDAGRLNAVSFWVGPPPRDLLVVINRDTRSGRERQLGLPSHSDFGELPVPLEGTLTLSGVIAPVPRPESTFSWGLSRPERARLVERGFYIHVRGIANVEKRPDGLDT